MSRDEELNHYAALALNIDRLKQDKGSLASRIAAATAELDKLQTEVARLAHSSMALAARLEEANGELARLYGNVPRRGDGLEG